MANSPGSSSWANSDMKSLFGGGPGDEAGHDDTMSNYTGSSGVETLFEENKAVGHVTKSGRKVYWNLMSKPPMPFQNPTRGSSSSDVVSSDGPITPALLRPDDRLPKPAPGTTWRMKDDERSRSDRRGGRIDEAKELDLTANYDKSSDIQEMLWGSLPDLQTIESVPKDVVDSMSKEWVATGLQIQQSSTPENC